MVAKKRPRNYNPVIYVVNASSILSKYETKKCRY